MMIKPRHNTGLCVSGVVDLLEQAEDAIEIYEREEIEGDPSIWRGTVRAKIPYLKEYTLLADLSECWPEGGIPAGGVVYKDGHSVRLVLTELDCATMRGEYTLDIIE